MRTWNNFILPYEHLEWSWLRPQSVEMPWTKCPRTKCLERCVSWTMRPWSTYPDHGSHTFLDNHNSFSHTLELSQVLRKLRSPNPIRHNVSNPSVRGRMDGSYGDASSMDSRSGTHRSGSNWHCMHRDNSPGGQQAGGELFWSDSSSFHYTCSPRDKLWIIYKIMKDSHGCKHETILEEYCTSRRC